MKTILICVLSLVPFLVFAQSDSTVPAENNSRGWYVGLGPAIGIPAQNMTPWIGTGFGGKVCVGYDFDQNLGFRFDVDCLTYSYPPVPAGSNPGFNPPNNFYFDDIWLMPELKFTLPMNGWASYVFYGNGTDVSFDGNNYSHLDAVAGLGAQFDLGNKIKLFVEGKAYFQLFQTNPYMASSYGTGGTSYFPDPSTVIDCPVEAGLTFGL
jgi:hypothetical protein